MNEDELLNDFWLTDTGERVYVEQVDPARGVFPARVFAVYLSGLKEGQREVLVAHTLRPIEK